MRQRGNDWQAVEGSIDRHRVRCLLFPRRRLCSGTRRSARGAGRQVPCIADIESAEAGSVEDGIFAGLAARHASAPPPYSPLLVCHGMSALQRQPSPGAAWRTAAPAAKLTSCSYCWHRLRATPDSPKLNGYDWLGTRRNHARTCRNRRRCNCPRKAA